MIRRLRPSPVLFALFVCALAGAADPAVGDARKAVEAELGAPVATRVTPEGEVALYERGTVTYRDGRVSALKIVPSDEWRRRNEAAEAVRRRAEILEGERLKRVAEANAARDALLVRPDFSLLSPAGKIERLEALLAEQPQAEVVPLLADLRRTLAADTASRKLAEDADRARLAQARRVDELVSRLDAAEKARAAAERSADAAAARIGVLERELATLNGRMAVMEDLVRTRVVYPGPVPLPASSTTIQTSSGSGVTVTNTKK